MTFEQVLQLLILAVVVLVFWWTHRSFPPQQTSQLLRDLTEASRQTQNRLDDVLVLVAKLLYDQTADNESSKDERS